MEIRKEIIRTGKHVYINQAGSPRVLDVTPEKVKHYHDSGMKMLLSGLPIPVPLEHDQNVNPLSAAERNAELLRNNAGETKRFELGKVKDPDGVEQDALFGVLDIRDEQISNKIKDATIKWCSPWIDSFTDGKGNDWNEVISHVALTTRPRVHEQQPFELSACMSLAAKPKSKVKTIPAEGVVLSRAMRVKVTGKKFEPLYPMAFSVVSGAKLAMADIEEDDDGDADGGEEDADDTDDMVEQDSIDPVNEGSEDATDPIVASDPMSGMDDAAGDVSFEELIPHLLELHGIHIPAGGKGKEFLKALVRGLLASAKIMTTPDSDAGVLDPEPGQPQDADKIKNPVMQETPPMMMSLEQVNAIKDPTQKQLASALFSLQKEREKDNALTNALRTKAINDAKRVRDARVAKIVQFLDAGDRDALLKSIGGAQLSMQADGTVIDPSETMLASMEKMAQMIGRYQGLEVRLSAADEVAQPRDGVGITPERREEIMREMNVSRKSA